LIDWPAVRQATRTIPIVFVGISDPVSVAGWSFPDLPMRGRVEVDRRSRGDTVFTIDKRSEKGFWTTVGAVPDRKAQPRAFAVLVSPQRWFKNRTANSQRSRKPMIVALARKLIIALWNYVNTGVAPDGFKLAK
jgi:hypothetical protein